MIKYGFGQLKYANLYDYIWAWSNIYGLGLLNYASLYNYNKQYIWALIIEIR